MSSDDHFNPIKIYRGPMWAGGKFSYELRDDVENTYGGSGLSFDELIECLRKHFKMQTSEKTGEET